MPPSDPTTPVPDDQFAKPGPGQAGKAAGPDDVPLPGSHSWTRVVDLQSMRGQS
jgi:hypothetical protein